MVVDTAMLEAFLRWLVDASWKGSVVIGLVLGVQALLRTRFPARWTDGLWLLVLLRLVAPPLPDSDVSLFNLQNHVDLGDLFHPGLPTDQESLIPERPPLHMSPAAHGEARGAMHLVSQNQNPHALSVGATEGFSPVLVLFTLWLSGVLLLLGVGLGKGLPFWLRVRRLPSVSDPSLLTLLDACRQHMGIHQPVMLSETDLVGGPAQTGIFRPRLLLPRGLSATLSTAELRVIFCHELAHIKRRDVVVRGVAALIQCVHWFNPVVWWGLHRMRADCELSCDALVLSRLQPDEHRRYGQTILTLLERLTAPRPVSGSVGILGRKTEIHRRIIMISRYQTASRLTSALAIALVAGLGGVTLTEARAPQSASQALHASDSTTDRPAASKPQGLETASSATGSATGSVASESLSPLAGVRIVPPARMASKPPSDGGASNSGASQSPATGVDGLDSVKARLALPIRVELEHATVLQVLKAISATSGVPFEFSKETLKYLSGDREIHLSLEVSSADEALRTILPAAGLGSCISAEGVHIEPDPLSEANASQGQSWGGGLQNRW